MALIKIDSKTIELTKGNHFYRAIPQGFAEESIFLMTQRFAKEGYMARTGNGGTFFAEDLLKGLVYAREWALLMDSKVKAPFTDYITLFRINARPYLDRICRDDAENEGIIVNGLISLEDIEVLFSAEKNILDSLVIEEVVLPSKLYREDINGCFKMRKEDLIQVASSLPERTLINSYNKNKGLLVDKIYAYFEKKYSREKIDELLPKVVSLFSKN